MMKTILKGFVISAIAIASISAANAWQCKVHNARGQVWFGSAATRAGAVANAMGFCAAGSAYAKNCVVDYCQPGNTVPVTGTWQCTAGNARGQVFVGTGPTRAIATANVMGYCSANSAYARNCYIKGCALH